MKYFQEEEIVYYSTDSVVNTDKAVYYRFEFFNTINLAGLSCHKLSLRVGTPVMLLRNKKSPKLCNGTRLQGFASEFSRSHYFDGVGLGRIVFLPRRPLIPNDLPFEFKRLQFPVKVCFSMTKILFFTRTVLRCMFLCEVSWLS